MKHVVFQLKPKDVIVLLGALVQKSPAYTLSCLARELKMSQPEVYQSLKRAQLCKLYDPLTRRPIRRALEEFLHCGLPYVFATQPGEMTEGVPTAHSAPPLSQQILSAPDDQYVWAFKGGKIRGKKITPLYSSVPEIALASPELHQMFALVDALRVGKAREREIARKEISERIRNI